MAKKKTGDDDSFFKDLASQTGGDIVADIDSVKYFVDSVNLLPGTPPPINRPLHM